MSMPQRTADLLAQVKSDPRSWYAQAPPQTQAYWLMSSLLPETDDEDRRREHDAAVELGRLNRDFDLGLLTTAERMNVADGTTGLERLAGRYELKKWARRVKDRLYKKVMAMDTCQWCQDGECSRCNEN